MGTQTTTTTGDWPALSWTTGQQTVASTRNQPTGAIHPAPMPTAKTEKLAENQVRIGLSSTRAAVSHPGAGFEFRGSPGFPARVAGSP